MVDPRLPRAEMADDEFIRQDPDRGDELVRASVQSWYLDKFGRELPDPTPLAPPVGYIKQEPLHVQIARMVRSQQLADEAAAAGAETFEEADDFDVEDGDDLQVLSTYENDFDPVAAEIARLQEAQRNAPPAAPAPPGPGPEAAVGGVAPAPGPAPTPSPAPPAPTP